MKRKVDARGLSCPEPVLVVRKVLQEHGVQDVEVIVDNKPAVENVTRAAENLGWQVNIVNLASDYMLHIRK